MTFEPRDDLHQILVHSWIGGWLGGRTCWVAVAVVVAAVVAADAVVVVVGEWKMRRSGRLGPSNIGAGASGGNWLGWEP